MQALGLIETNGLLAAVEGADTMLKAAEVTLLEKKHVGGGLVTITVAGEVAAVSAAVEAGIAAVKKLNSASLVSQHVIPRPDEALAGLFTAVKHDGNEVRQMAVGIAAEVVVEAEQEFEAEAEAELEPEQKTEAGEAPFAVNPKMTGKILTKDMVDTLVHDAGIEAAAAMLDTLKVAKLRSLAREYKEIAIAGRMISKADKKTLTAAIIASYLNE